MVGQPVTGRAALVQCPRCGRAAVGPLRRQPPPYGRALLVSGGVGLAVVGAAVRVWVAIVGGLLVAGLASHSLWRWQRTRAQYWCTHCGANWMRGNGRGGR